MLPDDLTDVSDVQMSVSEGGIVLCNLGLSATEGGIASEASVWGSDGFISVPNPPDADGACSALWLQAVDQKRIIGLSDYRYAEKGGALAVGDRAIVSNCDARVLLKRDTNEITIYTVNETDDDSAMMLDLNGSTGEILLVNGSSSISIKKDKIQISCKGTVLELTADGFGVFAKHCALNAGSGNLGTVGPVPPPQGAMSLLAGVSGIMGMPSTKWTVAT